ncbi:MAG: hypothetical protein AAB538_01125 [Patescibacteria group bacterium]
MGNLLFLLGFVVFVVGGLFGLLTWYEHKQKNTWKLVAEGEYDRVEVRSNVIAARRLRNMGLLAVTTVFFKDGKTWPVRGVIFEPPERGTRIRIHKNGFGESRIEVADQAA